MGGFVVEWIGRGGRRVDVVVCTGQELNLLVQVELGEGVFDVYWSHDGVVCFLFSSSILQSSRAELSPAQQDVVRTE